MTSSKVQNSSFVSSVPDSLYDCGELTCTNDGDTVTFVLPNSSLQELVSDAKKNKLVPYALSMVLRIEQDYTLAAVAGDANLYASSIARLSQWQCNVITPKNSQRFFGDGCRSLGLIEHFCREVINPAICLKAEARFRNGIPKRMDASTADTAGAADGYSDFAASIGQDPDSSFGSQLYQLAPVSLTAGGSRATASLSPRGQFDIVTIPVGRSASADGGIDGTNDAPEGEPLQVLTDKSTGWTITVQRNDLATAYSAGTTFTAAKVRLYVMVRYYRRGVDKKALAPGYYVQTQPSAQPFLMPQDWRILALFAGPKYGDKSQTCVTTGGQTLAMGYVPDNYFASVGASAKLYWSETRDGSQTIVFPVSRIQQHPYNVITDVVNTAVESGIRAARRHSRMGLETPDVASAPWSAATSTRIAAFAANSVTPAQAGVPGSILARITHPVSGLWRLPMCETNPSMRGMPGGTMNLGDLRNIQATITTQGMPAFASGNPLYAIRDAGVVDEATPEGFVNATAMESFANEGNGNAAETRGTAMPDGKSPRNAAIIATGMVPVVIPES